MHYKTKHKGLKRIILITLSIGIINSAIFPTTCLALSAGAGTPEFSSFEPVDATDMVNLLTGDFTYNLPILNVPGPNGGYSLSMFYHAGIQPQQESSWLGLGWNLNAGSLNRTVNGIPDDWKAKTSTVLSYNSPNHAYDYGISVGFGFKGIWGVNASLNGGSYKSLGGSVGASVGNEIGGLAVGIGTEGVSAGVYSQATGLSVGAGAGWNGGGQVQLSAGGTSVGVSFSNAGTTAFASVQGNAQPLGVDAVGSTDVQVGQQGGSAFFIIYGVSIGLSFNYYTYWLWKMEDKTNFGTLYTKDAKLTSDDGAQNATYVGDAYSNPFSSEHYNNGKAQAGSNALTFPNYDRYTVSGQGISGSISPRINQFGALTQEGNTFEKFADGTSKVELIYWNRYNFSRDYNKIFFQFDYEPGAFSVVSPGTYYVNNSTQPIWGHTYTGGVFSADFGGFSSYNPTTERLGKRKHIEFFTNSEITSNLSGSISRGFIESEGQTRGDGNLYDPDGIGAFSITAEDGKTYHYSIPVYQFEEIEVFEQRTNPTAQYMENRKLNKYAYDWLLTSITGPDYVDRGTAGVVDEDDYGYWVKFDYGKWTDGYVWRAPYEDNSYTPGSVQTPYGAYSMGRKQMYYLNAIKTKTHSAYFIKSLKEDGKGKTINYRPDDEYHFRWESNKATLVLGQNLCGSFVANGMYFNVKAYETEKFSSAEKHYTLKLDKIILINNTDAFEYEAGLSGNNNGGGNNFKTKNTTGSMTIESKILMQNALGQDITHCKSTFERLFTSYYQEKVLDKNDVQQYMSYIQQKALKIIEFNHNYSLCPGTPNSDATTAMGNGSVNGGKLTLTSVKIYGLGKADVLPGYYFSYNNQTSNPVGYSLYNTDNWGYYSNGPKDDLQAKANQDAWSLNEITTPLGGKIKINYEQDTYAREAVFSGLPEMKKNVSSRIFINGGTHMQVTLEGVTTEDMNALISSGTLKIGATYEMYGLVESLHGGNPNAYGKFLSTLLSYDVNLKRLVFDEAVYNGFYPFPETITFNPKVAYGGGIRVKDISLDDGAGNSYKTVYSYTNPGTTTSSGVTSYAPTLSQRYIPYLNEIPGPGVMYKYVTVENIGVTTKSYLKTQYTFDVLENASISGFDFSMGKAVAVKDIQQSLRIGYTTAGNHDHYIYGRSGVVTDNKASIGRILEITQSTSNNDVLNKQTYTYEDVFTNFVYGTHQETFTDNKRVLYWEKPNHVYSSSDWYLTSSSRVMGPSLLKSVTTETNGVKSVKTNTKYDFFTGIPTETKIENPDGQTYLSQTVLAYTKFPEMGPKVFNNSNKNMLSQTAASYFRSYNGTTNPIISASVQTWKNSWNYRELISSNYTDNTQTDVWRKYQNYVWKSDIHKDGTINGTFVDFNWAGVPNAAWQKLHEVTRYDHYSEPLESKDINGNYASIKKGGKKGNYIIANSSSSNYQGFFHTSFEDYTNSHFGGEVKLGDGTIETFGYDSWDPTKMVKPHTGKYMIKLLYNKSGPEYVIKSNLQVGKTYQASVWVYKNSGTGLHLSAELDGTINGSASTLSSASNSSALTTIHAGEWDLIKVEIEVPPSYIPSGGPLGVNGLRLRIETFGFGNADCFIDDMRLQPVNSNVNGYVYDERTTLMTASLDNENFATFYTYDAAGRLIKVEKETALGIKKIKETNYHYKQ